VSLASRPVLTSTASGLVGIALTLHGARAGTLVGMVEIGVGALFCFLALSLGSQVAASPDPAPSRDEREVPSR